MARASRALGWHPDFALDTLLSPADQAAALRYPVPPAGLFTLVHLPR
jgi:phosphatidylethanolamine/phosphatidyl-N-methylethanolamine N-methyltransferase